MIFDDFRPKDDREQRMEWELLGHSHERVTCSVVDGHLQVSKGGVKYSIEFTPEQLRPVVELLTFLRLEKFTPVEEEMMRDVVAHELLAIDGR